MQNRGTGLDGEQPKALTYAEIRQVMRKLPRLKFFASRQIVGEGFFGWVFSDGPDKVIKASFDRGFRELMTAPDRPVSLHLPRLEFDYGEVAMPGGLRLHVIGCERLARIAPLGPLWQVAVDLNAALDEAWAKEAPSLNAPDRMRALVKKFDALDDATGDLSLKLCLRDMHAFANRHGLALSPYFTSHQDNLMERAGEDLVFVNPLYDPAIQGLPSWMFGEADSGLGAPRLGSGSGRAKMVLDEDEFKEQTGGAL